MISGVVFLEGAKLISGGSNMPQDMKVTVRRGDGYVVVYTDGYINNIGGEKIAEECYKLMDDGCRHFILNLGKSRIINSIGVSILIEVIERVQEMEGSVCFCSLTPTIAKTFRIMRLTDASEIYGDEEEAIGAMAS
jgi:anti-anti-sigma factor